jgi:RluA family pseudouridine synthase
MTLPEILLEDDQLVAFDKPAGMPVAPGGPRARGTSLIEAARERYGRQLSAVHRLDEGASGIVVFARTKQALDFVSGQFQSKTVDCAYLAIVALLPAAGEPAPVRDAAGLLRPEFSVDLPLGEDRHRPGMLRVTKGRGGVAAETRVRVLESFGRFAWVECRPLGGRARQTRAHLAACAAPVLNDALYGDPAVQLLLSGLKRRYKAGREPERPLISRLAMHLASIAFAHPSGRERVEISAPVPEDLGIALKYLRKFGGGAGLPARRAP